MAETSRPIYACWGQALPKFEGEDPRPATHYHYGKGGVFFAEFLALMIHVSEAGNPPFPNRF